MWSEYWVTFQVMIFWILTPCSNVVGSRTSIFIAEETSHLVSVYWLRHLMFHIKAVSMQEVNNR